MKRFSALKNKKALLIVPVVLVASVIGVNVANDQPPVASEVESITVSGQQIPTAVDLGTEPEIAPSVQNWSPSEPQGETPTEPVTEPITEPEPEPEPTPEPPHVTGKTKRFVQVSENKREQYCDYSFSDGTTQSVLTATVSENVSVVCPSSP